MKESYEEQLAIAYCGTSETWPIFPIAKPAEVGLGFARRRQKSLIV